MRSIQLVASLVLASAFGAIASTALASDRNFCLVGAANNDAQNLHCASGWIAANGTQLGQVPDPRNTPKTPHNTASSVWSSSSASYTSGGHATPVWQAPTRVYSSQAQRYTPPSHHQAAPQPQIREVFVTRGAAQSTVYSGDWKQQVYTRPVPSAPIHQGATCGSTYTAPAVSRGTYRHQTNNCGHYSNRHTSGSSECFTYAQGQRQAVACPQATTNTWTNTSQSYPVTVVQQTSHTQTISDGFFNGLNGGVGGGAVSFYGGGGGGSFISSGSSSVFGRASFVRFGTKNRGGGNKMKKGGHGGNKGKGGHRGGKGGGKGGGKSGH